MFYDFLLKTYGLNQPIFVSEISYNNMSQNSIRQQIMNYASGGKLKRYDTGIYFIPEKSIFKSSGTLSQNTVIERKYLVEGSTRCGYISGLNFANRLGITTQVPASCEVVTNKASKDYREATLASEKIIIRKPRVAVDESNYKYLQFLDLIKDIDLYSELEEPQLKDRLNIYIKNSGIKFSQLEQFLSLYPDKLFRNMYRVGILNGISA